MAKGGCFLAQAYVPAQNIESGVINIAVLEGRYGAVDLRNHSRLKDNVARGALAGPDSGDIAESAALERRPLFLSDLSGKPCDRCRLCHKRHCPNAGAALELERMKPQGRVIVKRCGRSDNIKGTLLAEDETP